MNIITHALTGKHLHTQPHTHTHTHTHTNTTHKKHTHTPAASTEGCPQGCAHLQAYGCRGRRGWKLRKV